MRKLLLAAWFALLGTALSAQVTTAVVQGEVTDADGEAVIGAVVLAVHEPSGTRYVGVTNREGRYSIRGMRAGGPYTLEVSSLGMETARMQGATLRLGEALRHDVRLEESSVEVGEVVVAHRTGVDATRTGAAMSVSEREIVRMPSITHGIADAIRLNPQVRITPSGAIHFVGTNNRYNSFRIDGVMNNDVYGLATNGSNGGQAGTQPVSMETIQEIQINVAPFDIRQSGFTGGAINAITKSGTNQWHGSLYGFGNNQNLIGNSYRKADGSTSGKYTDQYEYRAGATLGGAIVRNRLFFFASYERTNKTYVNPYSIGSAASRIDAAQAAAILEQLKRMAAGQGLGYGGDLDATDVYTKSDKAGLKLDWNISDAHNLSVRWSLVSARQMNSVSAAATLNSSDFAYDFVSVANSWVAELNSRLTDRSSNELRVSYLRVRDRREPGAPFPMVQISNVGDGTLNLGNDRSSMANSLDQDIWSLTDNFTWQLGRHTLVAGTHNEFYRFSNLFIQDAYGSYFFGSPDDFLAGRIKQYRYAQANIDVTGDPRWAASFAAGMLGFYLQDDYDVLHGLTLTFGLRMDIPLFFDRPAENAPFNAFMASKGLSYRTNTRLSSTPLFSPRFGFRWDVDPSQGLVLRGGAGIFTGRLPFVWMSNNFANTGVQIAAYASTLSEELAGLRLILDPSKQMENAGKLTASGSQMINVFDRNFRMPQNLRLDLALDFTLGAIEWTAEAIYSKTINDVTYRNLAVDLNGQTFDQLYPEMDFDRRPMLSKIDGASTYSGIYLLGNSSKGYTWNLSLTGRRRFDFGLDVMASYTYMRSTSHNSGTSSVAQSNWQFNCTVGDPNAEDLANSPFNMPHSIKAAVFYTRTWSPRHATTVGLVYEGHSGAPYSVCYNGDLNGDTGYNDLIYIPTDDQIDRMNFAPTSNYSAEAQRANLKAWLAGDSYLRRHRGEYFERNAANERFEHHFDLHLAHRFDFLLGKSMRGLELSLDLVNIGNLFCREWGRTSVVTGYYAPINYIGGGNFQFLHDADYDMHLLDDYCSRWRGQVGLRFIF